MDGMARAAFKTLPEPTSPPLNERLEFHNSQECRIPPARQTFVHLSTTKSADGQRLREVPIHPQEGAGFVALLTDNRLNATRRGDVTVKLPIEDPEDRRNGIGKRRG